MHTRTARLRRPFGLLLVKLTPGLDIGIRILPHVLQRWEAMAQRVLGEVLEVSQ